MKIVFVSNFLNHHQISFCEEMRNRCDSFFFVSFENGERQGYQTSAEREYVVDYRREKERAESVIESADAVIYGGAPAELVEVRMRENKLSFFYAERFFKKGVWRRFIPTTYKKIYNSLLQYKDKKMYVLSASAYLPFDLSLLHFPADKVYKWGYFPEFKGYDETDDLIDAKKPNSIIWAARFIDWKHPEVAINTAKRLKRDGYDFEMNIIGNGDMFDEIKENIKSENLCDNVHLTGSMKPEQVREYMEKSEIHIFTSDRNEGWGAVLNEAMNSGCVPVANKAIGSAPYLIRDGENGFMYNDENELYEKLKYLLDNEGERKKAAEKAYDTIALEWNARVAAERFIDMATRLLNGENSVTYDDGPCSPAKIFKDNWRK